MYVLKSPQTDLPCRKNCCTAVSRGVAGQVAKICRVCIHMSMYCTRYVEITVHKTENRSTVVVLYLSISVQLRINKN